MLLKQIKILTNKIKMEASRDVEGSKVDKHHTVKGQRMNIRRSASLLINLCKKILQRSFTSDV